MKQFLAYFLCALLLLQSFGRELLVLHYALNKAQITAQYCVNKARPALDCHGKCHLTKLLRQAEGSEKKAPAGLAKVKLEALLPLRPLLPAVMPAGPAAALRYARLPVPALVPAAWPGVFRPPVFQS